MSLEGREILIGTKYKLGRKIGAGSFGEIYLGNESHILNKKRLKCNKISSIKSMLIFL